MSTTPTTKEQTAATVFPQLTDEERQALRAVAGRLKDDPTMDAWEEEMRQFREHVNQQEAARRDAQDKK